MNIFATDTFKNKHVVISGGAGDIGMAIALGFANAGAAHIALLDKNIENLTDLVKQITALGTKCTPLKLDLENPEEIENTVKRLFAMNPTWEILVTTAGLYTGGSLTEFKIDDWDKLIRINARQFLCSHVFLQKK